jgi:DNA primase
VASCGTALAETQIKLLGRFTKRVIVNYDPDMAGQAATERSLTALLEQDFEVKVLALPPIGDKKADPDLYIREKGADAYLKQVKEAPPYVDYLIRRASKMDLTTGEGKRRAVNFLLPYVQKIPNNILRSEWATRIAQQLRLDEPVLRAALSKAATERRSEVKVQPELVRQSAMPAERRLIRMLAEAEGFRRELAQHLHASQIYLGLETEKIFVALVGATLAGGPFHASEVGAALEDRERRLFFEILFEDAQEPAWEEAQSCLDTLARKQIERELTDVQRGIEASPSATAMRELLTRKQELMRRLATAN